MATSDEEQEVLFREREEARLREWWNARDANFKALAAWSRRMAVLPSRTDPQYVQRVESVLSYVIRMLSKGTVPRVQLVNTMLDGTAPVPGCGYLGCFLELDDHVH